MIILKPADNLNFNSYRHSILNKRGKVVNRGDTCMFRWDLNPDCLINFIEYKYRDTDKVNILVHACSDGEEVYSLLSTMIESLGLKNAKKYLPIRAKDIVSEHINLAKKGEYKITPMEEPAIDYYLGENFLKYFEYTSPTQIKAVSTLNKYVKFSKSDIMKDANTFNFDNTVLLARNFWHYLGSANMCKLAHILSKRMNKSSTLVIGDYDKQFGVDKILRKYGFYETRLKYVFEKRT